MESGVAYSPPGHGAKFDTRAGLVSKWVVILNGSYYLALLVFGVVEVKIVQRMLHRVGFVG